MSGDDREVSPEENNVFFHRAAGFSSQSQNQKSSH